jgi:hypothetical protein
MESKHFDSITSTFAQIQSRRGTFRLLGAAVLSAGGLGILLSEDGEARRKKGKGKGKGKGRCLKSGKSCKNDKQCCSKDNLICDVPQNASNSDTECCGEQGATCGGVNDDGDFLEPYCCIGEAGERSFICSQNDPGNPNVRGTCIPAPDDEF